LPTVVLIPSASKSIFVCVSVAKVGFAFDFALGTFGFVLALVQAHFSGYPAGFGWLLCGLGF
jgi:hypothetical protein